MPNFIKIVNYLAIKLENHFKFDHKNRYLNYLILVNK